MARITKREKAQKKLFEAAGKGDQDGIEAALAEGADINTPDDRGDTALMYTVRNGHERASRILLAHKPDINVANKDGETALLWAARNGHSDTCLLLIEHDADVHAKDKKNHTTVLMRAANHGLVRVCQKLFEKNVEVNAADSFYEKTALIYAAESGRGDICRMLIERGAFLDALTAEHETALSSAIQGGFNGVARILLRAGALHGADEVIDSYLKTMGASARKTLSSAKVLTDDDCFRGWLPSDAVLDACVTGQFGTLVAAPLIASDRPEDRQLFQRVWDALPPRWQNEYTILRIQFLKAGGVKPVVGHFTGQTQRSVGDEKAIAP